MLATSKTIQYLWMIFILFIWINFSHTQSTTTQSHLRDIRITPNEVVINSTSITNFVCINHQPSSLPLEAKLSKIIPSNQMKLTITSSNISTLNIRLEANNYIGIFHLLCYEKGQQTNGNLADVFAIADPGTLKRAPFCEVFEKQYITCKIFAKNIATAIQNGYKPKFKFNETTHPADRTAYIPRYEFLENESTNEYLVFKWRPSVDGVFPKGVWMHMWQLLDHFKPSEYVFEIIPVFRIKPKYTLKALSSSKVLIDLTSISPPSYCEKSILPSLTSTINKIWTAIEPGRTSINADNFIPDTIYRVCIKCKQVYNDPDGVEECQEITTLSNKIYFIVLIVILMLVVLATIFVIVSLCIKKRNPARRPSTKFKTKTKHKTIFPNHYDMDPTSTRGSNTFLQLDDEPSPTESLVGTPESNDNTEPKYLPIPSIYEILEANSPKELF